MRKRDYECSGQKIGLNSHDKSKWLLPMLVLLSATAVIALLFFSLYQRTEAKFLALQYLVEDVEAEADVKVRLAQRELFLMSQKYRVVQSDIAGMQNQLAQLQKNNTPQVQTKHEDRKKEPRTKPIKPRGKRGLEDLDFGGETAVSSAKDDPAIGFKKGELL